MPERLRRLFDRASRRSPPVVPRNTTSQYGLKQLHEPSEVSGPAVDIVFVHGLTGSAGDTWHHKDTGFYWPANIGTGNHVPARVFTFGYDADVAKFWQPVSQLGIDNHASNLLGSLARVRSETETVSTFLTIPSDCRRTVLGNNFDKETRKIIFIAHSLGGLVAQNALCLSQTSAEIHIRDVGNSILAIMFLGTPHLGADIASWARLGTSIASLVTRPARDLVRVLEPGSEMLASIQDRFHSI
ncbi:uncharacterized protein APUU_51515A [Aspergillus puulaauensis]|uniref:DUF676 domain-containing protein n=1 Tax=Aspergillus puulaauensis TaxID=1220207 RepID=A0A7R7XU21_9EURO|nr:uncharacterized protein APUU_51515A [Aspergillus puulaauensis]BCS26804.1 hypothetical protein APUU_51515A [Aspergillus puulaauensis]